MEVSQARLKFAKRILAVLIVSAILIVVALAVVVYNWISADVKAEPIDEKTITLQQEIQPQKRGTIVTH